MDSSPRKSRFRVAPNIALVKYWGKFLEDSVLPLNSSLSLTLSTEDLYTETQVSLSEKYSEDILKLNGVIAKKLSPRLSQILDFFRTKCKIPTNFHFKIKTSNNFPTAAGLASSSSGFAAIVLCVADLLNFLEEFPGQLTEIARRGSGSASRGLFGGMVEWQGVPIVYINEEYKEMLIKGQLALGEPERRELERHCIAKQVFDQGVFKDFVVLILVAHENEKEVPSTEGMRCSVNTSDLLWHRVLNIVPERLRKMKEAVKERDMNKVMKLMIKDSNQFHAVCLDTYPPLFYLNDFSRNVINLVVKVNKIVEKHIGYTFDAGPHAVLLIHREIYEDFFKLIVNISKAEEKSLNPRAKGFLHSLEKEKLEVYQEKALKEVEISFAGKIQPHQIIQTEVGAGPAKI